MKYSFVLGMVLLFSVTSALAAGLDRPWIADTYFYWYTWDYEQQFGGWVGGVWNTPLYGYYDSPSYRDNLRSLRTAAEWGLTDHFMDYWGPGWKGENGEPREATVMRAAEELQRRGYNIHMSFYQDGEDFDMEDFERNLDVGRHFRFYVENWGDSPALPKIEHEPVYLIYGRNGLPQPTKDNTGFREWLRSRYADLDSLNQAWGTALESWEEVELDFGTGVRRADSIRYATYVWQSQWNRTKHRAVSELRKPAPRVSFDAAYQPYLGWGYSPLPKALGGPHSYAGIFGVPHEQDTERFIQGAVAKAYGTVFFDHFKNYYHDIEIRTPGTIYPPDFLAFDRFWAGALVRRSEALFHLSWNEWWEGSNLEPCWEFGKTYCEKNLLWSSIMQQCFDSLHNWNRGAKVAVLLNDWLWLVGARHTEDVYGCIEGLRRANVTFDLLPDDFVTRERLASIETVIAPTGGAGLGINAAGESISEILKTWIEQRRATEKEPIRRLIISSMPEYVSWLGIPRADIKRNLGRGPDMNIFVDIGKEGDEEFLKDGMSFREDWGKLPEGAFGAVKGEQTRRWTPAVGNTTTFVFPLAPNRDHILRFQGVGFRENRMAVVLGDREVGSLDIAAGIREYELLIPARLVGDKKISELRFVYERANMPGEIDPESYPNERRVCNLALDWVQLSTDNIPPHTTEQNYTIPKEQIRFDKSMPGLLKLKTMRIGWTPREVLTPLPRQVRSRYASDGVPRDIMVKRGDNEVWYCNGLVGAHEGRIIERLVLDWAGHPREWTLEGEHLKGALLNAGGNTRVAVVYNFSPSEVVPLRIRVPMTARSLVEVMALSVDGRALRPIQSGVTVADGMVTIEDKIRYYGAYAISCGPVQATIPPLEVIPGASVKFQIALDNNEPRPIRTEVSLITPIPTLRAASVSTELGEYEDANVPFELHCAEEADWGEKTVIFDLATSGRHVYLWRPVRVLRQPEPEITTTVIDCARPDLIVRNTEHPLSSSGVAVRTKVEIEGKPIIFGNLASGEEATRTLALPLGGERPRLITHLAELSWEIGDRRQRRVQAVHLAEYPRQYPRIPAAVAPLLVFNAAEKPLTDRVVSVPIEALRRWVRGNAHRLYVRDAVGAPVASQTSADGRALLFLAKVEPYAAQTYYVCLGEAPEVRTELAITSEALGSGHGKITIGNEALELVFDEQAGGTVASFRSLATNAQYGANSFGITYGTWNRMPRLDSPVMRTPDFLGDGVRHAQTESPAKLTLVEGGPVRAIVRADWCDGTVTASQTYEVTSKAQWVRIRSSATLSHNLGRSEELVLLDGRLKRTNLTKIFPNFVGINTTFEEEYLHHGWRMADYVPEYFTCMKPNDFPESVSFVLLQRDGIDAARQGFWPAQRGTAGPCEYAWVELISYKQTASAVVDVLVHKGHQPVAAAHLNDYRNPPLVIVPARFVWEESDSRRD